MYFIFFDIIFIALCEVASRGTACYLRIASRISLMLLGASLELWSHQMISIMSFSLCTDYPFLASCTKAIAASKRKMPRHSIYETTIFVQLLHPCFRTYSKIRTFLYDFSCTIFSMLSEQRAWPDSSVNLEMENVDNPSTPINCQVIGKLNSLQMESNLTELEISIDSKHVINHINLNKTLDLW